MYQKFKIKLKYNINVLPSSGYFRFTWFSFTFCVHVSDTEDSLGYMD